MLDSDPRDITIMLQRVTDGDHTAIDQLMPLVYEELRALADRHTAAERAAHTLQATALVHEAYLRLIGERDRTWQNRTHFFATASTAIRRILIDHARRRRRLKRGGSFRQIPLDEAVLATPDDDARLVALDESLTDLAAIDAQKARVVELRFFAGLNVEEAAAALGVSASTVARDWRFARAWLRSRIEEDSDGS